MSRSSTMGHIRLVGWRDEDFMDERPSSKRMREDLSNQDDTDSDCSSFQGDYDGEQQTRVPRVSLNGDGDGGSDRAAV
jgi:hypothetical protein